MPPARRPHAVVGTEARVSRWQDDGQRPPVAVWTTDQISSFLAFVADDPLYPLWWLVALRVLDLPASLSGNYGSWYFDCAVHDLPGGWVRLRRGGFPTRREAVAAIPS
jgi:hypothetical protein